MWSAPVAFRRVALETREWTSRDSNHHRQSVSAGKTNAIPTEPSGRLCVLARGCDSCTHEPGEVEVADMGCVLARSCDSCTHEPWFWGLKFGDEVGLGDSSNLETRFVNDPSRGLCATVPMKVVLVRAHDWFDDHSEVSVEQQIEPYLKFLRPLLFTGR